MTTALAKRNGNPTVGFERMFDFWPDSLRRFLDGNFWDVDNRAVQGTVPVNLREAADHYEMDVIAPGCRKEDFQLQVKHNELTIAYERRQDNNSNREGWVRNEYFLQSFRRSFTMDETIDYGNIKASYTDGILRLTIPKNEKAKMVNRQIEIQ